MAQVSSPLALPWPCPGPRCPPWGVNALPCPTLPLVMPNSNRPAAVGRPPDAAVGAAHVPCPGTGSPPGSSPPVPPSAAPSPSRGRRTVGGGGGGHAACNTWCALYFQCPLGGHRCFGNLCPRSLWVGCLIPTPPLAVSALPSPVMPPPAPTPVGLPLEWCGIWKIKVRAFAAFCLKRKRTVPDTVGSLHSSCRLED